ncbi:hypothetical protein RY966_002398 [Enterobacter kobei]|nr:hypothetical protein [Enterobacter kobei]
MSDENTALLMFVWWLIFTLLLFVCFCREERGKSQRERTDPVMLLAYASGWPIYMMILPTILFIELVTWFYDKIAGKPAD